MRKKISFAGPWITQKEVDYVVDAVKNGFYETYDMHVRRLERAVADYLGVKHTLATHCCTLALHLAAESLRLSQGDEVIVTDCSWVATANAVAYTGATCVFVDIEPDTWCISPAAIRAAITPKTRAIMLVHMYGQPAQMDEIMAIANAHGLRVIEDAAPSLGSEFRGKKTGSFGDIGCFSFHGAKIAVSGEGGIFVTNRQDLHDRAALLASMGRTDSQGVYWCDVMGYQYTIGNLSAALALAQVERIEELVAQKRQIFGWYEERLRGVGGLKLVREREGCKSNCCYPGVLLEDSVRVSRDEVLAKLRALNIHFRPAHPRMSRFPMYQQRFPNPVAEKVEKRGMTMASAANIVEDDIDFVCKSLIEIIRG